MSSLKVVIINNIMCDVTPMKGWTFLTYYTIAAV